MKIIEDRGTRATSRQRGIDAVETEWHVHVDSDVILCDGWMDKAFHYCDDSSVGAVWGVTAPLGKTEIDEVRALAKLRNISTVDYQLRQARYLLHDTMIRSEAVRGIAIQPDQHVQEDRFIGDYITSKGYRWVKAKEPNCLHRLTGRDEAGIRKEAFLSGYLYHEYGMRSLSSITRNAVLALPKSLWILAYTMNYTAAKRLLMTQTLPLKGWFSYRGDGVKKG